jgi:RNA recognition motif-containing protein
MRTLYVGGLGPETTADRLRDLFEEYGGISDARVVLRPRTGKCRGFGYVTFLMDRDALAAMQKLDGQVVRGNRLRVDLAR